MGSGQIEIPEGIRDLPILCYHPVHASAYLFPKVPHVAFLLKREPHCISQDAPEEPCAVCDSADDEDVSCYPIIKVDLDCQRMRLSQCFGPFVIDSLLGSGDDSA